MFVDHGVEVDGGLRQEVLHLGDGSVHLEGDLRLSQAHLRRRLLETLDALEVLKVPAAAHQHESVPGTVLGLRQGLEEEPEGPQLQLNGKVKGGGGLLQMILWYYDIFAF